MASNDNAGEGAGSLFVLATRLFVHYKFKTRASIDASVAMVDDQYARDVLKQIRQHKDPTLQAMADRFEAARFPDGVEPALEPG